MEPLRLASIVCSLLLSFMVPDGRGQTTPQHQPVKLAEGAYPDLAVDKAGNIHLVYVREGQLFYRQHSARTGAWSAEQSTGLRSAQPNRSDPEVVVDSRNRPHVLVGGSYAWFDGTKWIKIDPGVARDTAMAIDAGDNVYICRRGGAAGGHLGLRVRQAGAAAFESLPDPDIAGGLALGRNDHVYGHVFVSPKDNSLHLTYRHGTPTNCAYRVSHDGGRTWSGGGVSNDDFEAPSGLATRDGTIFVISGNGTVHQRTGGPGEWKNLGRAFSASKRDLPVLAADSAGNLYAAGFGGRYNIHTDGRWLGERKVPALSSKPIGFVALARGSGANALAVWEEGAAVNHDLVAGTSDIVFARLSPAAPAAAGPLVPRKVAAATGSKAVPAKAPPVRLTSAPVKQWDRFEAQLENRTAYKDPYRDVTLEVIYTRPDGTKVDFWGFHDGGQTWRFRCMPDQTGTWKFQAKFSDGSRGAEGTFQCVRSDIPGMIAVHAANPMWFGFKGGEAALIRGLHVGDRFFAKNWDDDANPSDGEKRAAFLDWAQQQGYNLLSVASHYLNRNTSGRGAGWDTPKLWPLDAAEFRRMEAILDDLARRRLLVYPFAGFLGRGSNFPPDPAEQTLYLRYTYARLGAWWNLLLNVAGPEPLLRGKPFLNRDELNRLGAEIQALNVFGQPLSVHNRTGNDECRDEPWLTYGTLQGPKTVDRKRLSRGLLESHHAHKPLLAQETLWSGNVNHIRANQRDYTDDELRKNAFVIHFSAAALVFADNDGDSSSGFSGTLDLNDRRQPRHDAIRRVWDFCATLPFGRLKPRQDLVSGDHAFCLAEPERYYAVYVERSAPVSVKLTGAETFRVTWINAEATDKRNDGGITRDGQNLTPPAGGDDWVLILEAR